MNYLQSNNKTIRKNFSDEEFEEIKLLTPWVKDQSRKSIRERVYCILNDINEIPKCPICGNDCHFLKGGKYSKTCSHSCGNLNPECQTKIKETCINKYGEVRYVNPKKAKKTSLKKYGVSHPSKLTKNRNKAKETTLQKYGNENYNNRKKAEKTCLEKYRVNNPSKFEEIKNKISIKQAKHFSDLKDENHKGHVYILYFIEHNAIKIGISTKIKKRLKELEKDFGEYEVIEIIKTGNCFGLERELHNEFDSYRICLNEGTGRTEFFKIECLNKLKDFINDL